HYAPPPPPPQPHSPPLHDALPISRIASREVIGGGCPGNGIRRSAASAATTAAPSRACRASWISVYSTEVTVMPSTQICGTASPLDRKSTRLNSSHVSISYAVFCLK